MLGDRVNNSLLSKRFQWRYYAKVKAGAKKKKKWKGKGEGRRGTLARKPHNSGKRPLIFHGSVHFKVTDN